MKKIQCALLVFSVAGILISEGCKKNNDNIKSLYTPTSADVTANATLQDLQQGRALYISNCANCHNLYSPDDYTPSQWKSILQTMTPRTNLTGPEILLVTKYVCKGNQ
jgi:mono/diheme cytochrome c family protein